MVFDENGAIANATDYYPYGEPLGQRNYSADPESDRMKFTGHERDWDVAGIDYHGARYYNPTVGRYLSVDPRQAEFPGWGSYVYVLGNPVMFVDPDGRAPTGPGGTGDTEIETVTITGRRPSWLGRRWRGLKRTVGDFFGHVGAYASGAANALSSDMLLGAGRVNPADFGDYAVSAQAGQRFGDILGIFSGAYMVVDGGLKTGGGTLAEATGIGVAPGAVVQGAGVAEATYGTGVFWVSWQNLMSSGEETGKNEARNIQKESGSGPGVDESPQQIERNFKKISDNQLKKSGIDAHQLKKDFLGSKAGISRYDLYKNTRTGEILILQKGGKGNPIQTGEFAK